MSTMVERVARAIWDVRRKTATEAGLSLPAWEAENELLREDVRREARAAIEAIQPEILAAEKRGKEEAAVRCERAKGRTLEEMRANVSADLTKHGDTVLAWVNEGDLIMSEIHAAAIRGS